MNDTDHVNELRRRAAAALRGHNAPASTLDPRGEHQRRQAERQAERDRAKRDAANALRRLRGEPPAVALQTADLGELVAGGRPLEFVTADDLNTAYMNRTK